MAGSDGIGVGRIVGARDVLWFPREGSQVGTLEGLEVGCRDGCVLGIDVGKAKGTTDGLLVG